MKESDYLELSKNPLRFEAVNQLTNVFFDDSNKEVLYRIAYDELIMFVITFSRYLPCVQAVLWELS